MKMLNYLKQFFIPTNYKYNDEISPSVKFCTYKSNKYGRIEFRLPNGQRKYFYGIQKLTMSKEQKKQLLFEFERLLRNGYFPHNQVLNLGIPKVAEKKADLELSNCIDDYYGKLNYGANEKKEKVIKNERSTLAYLLTYFAEVLSITNIRQITNNSLKHFDAEVHQWCEMKKNRTIKKSTIKSYKKIIKAFLNRMNKEYDFEYNTSKIDGTIYYSGKPDEESYSRHVFIPSELLDCVDKIETNNSQNHPNRIELIHFLRTTGLCKEELATLSTENLYPSTSNYDAISIINKPDCPTKYGIGLSLKSKNRERVIPLDKRSIQFINNQVKKHQHCTVYGQVGKTKEFIPYRFLFPVYTGERWRRCDNYLGSIRAIFKKTNNYFHLGYDTDSYQLHDFRRTLNNELGDAGISAGERSYILGHDVKVNKSNYSNYKKTKEKQQRIAEKSMREFFVKRRS